MPQTKAGMIEQCRSMSQENARVWEALIATQCGADVTVGRFTADNWHVTVKLINPTRAHGGIVLISSKDDDGNSSMSVTYLEDESRICHQAGEYGYNMRNLIGKALTMRAKELDSQAA